MNEADTRADLIDPKLREDGWGTVENSFIRREVICPGRIMAGGKRGTSVSSDYVLIYKEKKLAAVEAKKESLSYTEGVRQAKDYATRLQCRFGYATNGHEIYQIDCRTGKEQLVDDYLSPEEMWALSFDESDADFTKLWRDRFAAIPFETKGGSWNARYYQENAINAALEAIAKGDSRILLTLATGTGKTFIAFQLAWKLFHSKWSIQAQKSSAEPKRRPRILFLADRNILADQAFNAFSAFEEDAIVRIAPDEIKKKGAVPKNGSVFFTIFQTFMSGQNENKEPSPYFGDYPKDFFDFIIIDECHRGGANDESSWRDVMEYFSPAVQLGLTATPKRDDNTDTYKYFGEPVYSYTLKEGINDGFLTPFKVYPIAGTMDEYVYDPKDGKLVRGEPEPGRLYKESDFNRIITIPEREEMRVRYWMNLINPKEKTLVFCATQEHAGVVRDYINQYANKKYGINNSDYCVRVTANDGEAGEKDLRTFQDNEKTIPTILTTSRKLSTGVDARNVRNIVFMRQCKNMIEFKQIIGRGTRVFEGKDFFTIFDFVKAHENFQDDAWDGEPEDVIDGGGSGGGKPGGNGGEDTSGPGEGGGDEPEPTPEKIVFTLSDGKKREIRHLSSALYWSTEGTPITAQEFMQHLFDDLPSFFQTEDQLREIWSDPTTREKLLDELAEAGYDNERLDSMKALIEAKDSDVFDVLAYVAYAIKVMSREDRVKQSKPAINTHYADYKQQAFIDFVLQRYVDEGVHELSLSKMKSFLELQFGSISDGANELGGVDNIRETFTGFQHFLYDSISS